MNTSTNGNRLYFRSKTTEESITGSSLSARVLLVLRCRRTVRWENSILHIKELADGISAKTVHSACFSSLPADLRSLKSMALIKMLRLLLSLLYSVQSTTAVDSGSSKDKQFTVGLDSTDTNEVLLDRRFIPSISTSELLLKASPSFLTPPFPKSRSLVLSASIAARTIVFKGRRRPRFDKKRNVRSGMRQDYSVRILLPYLMEKVPLFLGNLSLLSEMTQRIR